MFLTVTKHAIEVTCFNEKTVFQTPPPSPRLPNSSSSLPIQAQVSFSEANKQVKKANKQTKTRQSKKNKNTQNKKT